MLNDDIRDSLANSGEEGAWFIAHWESIYLIYGGVLLSPLLIKGILTHSPSLIHSAEAAGNTTLKNEILSIYLAAVMQIKIANFAPRSLKVLDTPKVAWLSINEGYLGYTSLSVYSAHIDKLYRAHCYLLEGVLEGGKAGQKGYALLYQGEVLASSTRDEVRVVIERLNKYGINTAKVLENFITTIGKVEYGLSMLSQKAIAFRKTLGAAARHDGNIAVFEYINKEGIIDRIAFTTKTEEELKALGYIDEKPHAEEFGFEWLTENKIPDENVLAVYSELEPCLLNGHKCKQEITKRFPNANVSYSYTFNNKPEVMKRAIEDRAKDLKIFIK